jgi:hypothetical protein
VFNATFNNISVNSWRSVLLMEETWVHRENYRLDAYHWQSLLPFVLEYSFGSEKSVLNYFYIFLHFHLNHRYNCCIHCTCIHTRYIQNQWGISHIFQDILNLWYTSLLSQYIVHRSLVWLNENCFRISWKKNSHLVFNRNLSFINSLTFMFVIKT